MIKILGIETSCDETSVSIVSDTKQILANLIHSQIASHIPYGGVVPEIAARSHLEHLERLLIKVQIEAKTKLAEIDAIAVTSGPGLIGGLIVGVMAAKGIAHALNKPIISVNHLEGHALTARLVEDIEFPYLLLLISGGHCQILIVKNVGKYELLGTTKDDALGEAFDKLAKMLKLEYPGGPKIEKMALFGDKHKYKLPLAMVGRNNCDFSFSGIKTSLKNLIDEEQSQNNLTEQTKCDICASFQYVVTKIIEDRLKNAFTTYNKHYPHNKNLVIAGGVAANKYIRNSLEQFCFCQNFKLYFPPINLCTDNGAMIAWAGFERYRLNLIDDLAIEPKARWSLT